MNQEGPGHHLERLHALSKRVSDALNEILAMAYAQSQDLLWIKDSASDADIRLVDKSLWVNRIMIPLASREKTLSLIEAFFSSEDRMLSKTEIVAAVYGTKASHSPRFIEAQDGNLTKLLSRTRTFLEKSLAQTYQRPIDWLVFDIKVRRYHLYKYKTDFVNPT